MSPVSIELSQLERVGKKQTDSLRTLLHRLKVLCSWARLLTRAEPLSTQQYCCDGLAFHAGGGTTLLVALCYIIKSLK